MQLCDYKIFTSNGKMATQNNQGVYIEKCLQWRMGFIYESIYTNFGKSITLQTSVIIYKSSLASNEKIAIDASETKEQTRICRDLHNMASLILARK